MLVINTDKSCLIFLETRLEPEVWPASPGAFLEEEDQFPLSVGYSSLSDSASHPDIRSSSGNSHPLDLLKPASPLLVGLLMPFMQKHSPRVVERLRAARVWGVPQMPLRVTVNPRNWPSSSCNALWRSPARPGYY